MLGGSTPVRKVKEAMTRVPLLELEERAGEAICGRSIAGNERGIIGNQEQLRRRSFGTT